MIIKEIEGKRYLEIRKLEFLLIAISILFVLAVIALVIFLYLNPELYQCYCSNPAKPEINEINWSLIFNGTIGNP